MTYVIAEPCVDLLDKACIEECPVDCIYEGARMLYIHPDECVDCGACEPVCPVEAIYYEDDVPEQWADYTKANVDFFDELGSPGGASKVGKIGLRRGAGQEPAAATSTTSETGRPARLPLGLAGRGPRAGRGAPRRHRRPLGRHPGRPGARAWCGPRSRPGRRRPRLPDHARPGRRCGRRWPARWPAGSGSPSTRSRCCRRSAPRSWSPGCPRCSGSARATPW